MKDGNYEIYWKCGPIEGVYATVDFRSNQNVSRSFKVQRVGSPAGPLVNSEFYAGWLDLWGVEHQKINTTIILSSFHQQMVMNANVNFYMFMGGTNWGFSTGIVHFFKRLLIY